MVSKPDTGWCPNEDVGPQGGALWDPMLVGEGYQTFVIRMWKSWAIRNEPKRTISISGGLELLQIIVESHVGWKPNIAYKGLEIVRLTTIRNEQKQTISINSGLGLLQIIVVCYKLLWDPILVGKGNKTFLRRVWKPLPSDAF